MTASQNTFCQRDFKVPLTHSVSHTLLTVTPTNSSLCRNFQWVSLKHLRLSLI